jgi:hypothetical protein
VHRRAAGAGELLLADVFSRGVGKPRCRDNAGYHGNRTVQRK